MSKFASQLHELKRRYPGLLDGAVVEVIRDARIAESYNVKQVPMYILYYNRQEVARLVGRQTTEQLQSAIEKIHTPRPGAPAQLSGAGDKSLLRYEGKTFDEWRNAWRTELSTAKRTEAVKALAAFGANGYGKEAAEAILEVAGQYDWTSVGANKAVAPLQNACVAAFGGGGATGAVAQSIPATDALPALSAADKSDNRQQKLFLSYVLPWIPGPESVSEADAVEG